MESASLDPGRVIVGAGGPTPGSPRHVWHELLTRWHHIRPLYRIIFVSAVVSVFVCIGVIAALAMRDAHDMAAIKKDAPPNTNSSAKPGSGTDNGDTPAGSQQAQNNPEAPASGQQSPQASGSSGGSQGGGSSSGGSNGGSGGTGGSGGGSTSGYPSASNTGPSGCSAYTQYSGTLDITTDGTVLNCIQLDGTLTINASNVTVQNSILKGTSWWGIRIGNTNGSTNNFKLLHSKMYTTAGQGPDNGGYDYAIAQETVGSLEVGYNDISGYKEGVTMSQGYVHDNYIHNLSQFIGAHTQDIYVYTGPGQVKIEHNTLINDSPQSQATAAIYIAPDDGHQNDRVVTNNLMSGGAYTFYGGDSTATNISVTNNKFSTTLYPDSGYYGPVAYWQAGNSGNVWSGNTWYDGPNAGQAVNP